MNKQIIEALKKPTSKDEGIKCFMCRKLFPDFLIDTTIGYNVCVGCRELLRPYFRDDGTPRPREEVKEWLDYYEELNEIANRHHKSRK